MDDTLNIKVEKIINYKDIKNISHIQLPKILVSDPVSILFKLNHGDIVISDGQYYYIF